MIRLFVGCAPNHEDAESQAVLEWSIRRLASEPVEITWMMLSNEPGPFNGWDVSAWATPFSGLRWAVPELCGFQGKAIYCDSDFIFLADIAELWNQEVRPPYVAIGKGGNEWRMCCCVFDCSAARVHLPSIEQMKADPRAHGRNNQAFRHGQLVQPFVGDWNNLDGRHGEPLTSIKALHYSCMSTQPQLEYALPRLAKAGTRHWYDGQVGPHPRADVRWLFKGMLAEAIEAGYKPENYMQHKPYGVVKKRSFEGRTAF